MVDPDLRLSGPRRDAPVFPVAAPQAPSFAGAVERQREAAAAQAGPDAAVKMAREAQRQADELQKPFKDKAPESNPTAWNLYTAQQAVANEQRAKAEQAIAAELRQTYRGNKGNLAATEAKSHEIAYRYRDDPRAQQAVTTALATVTSETAAERASGEALYAVDLAGDTLEGLLADNAATRSVSDQELQAASDSLDAKRQDLVKAAEVALGQAYDALPTSVKLHEPDPLGYAAQQVASRHAGDPELKIAADTARILRDIADTPVDLQIKRLGELMPKSLDPTVRGLVRADPRIKAVEDAYVNGIIAQVRDTHDKEGTRRAGEKLRGLIEPRTNPAVPPDLKARIVNGLMPTITDLVHEVAGDRAMRGRGGGTTYATIDDRSNLAEDLSAVVDAVAAGSDTTSGTFDSPEIQKAVEGVGAVIARNPHMDIEGLGFERAVGAGYATLPLEVARQTKGLTRQDLPADRRYDHADLDRAEALLLDSIGKGLGKLKQNAKSQLDTTNKTMAPFLAPMDLYSADMSDEQLRHGMDALRRGNPDLIKAMGEDRAKLDDLGYKLVRAGEAVQFYHNALGDQGGYQQVDEARVDLMNASETASAIFLSDAATLRIGAQAARKKLGDDWRLAGAPLPQKYGIGAQLTGDFTEFMAETYVVRGVRGGENMPGVQATRVAHLPGLGGVGIWGVGGGFQAALTVYLYDNVKFDKDQKWREPLLLGLVGGFAAFHLAEAGMAVARLQPYMFDQLPRLRDALSARAPWVYVEEGSRRDLMTRSVVEATKPLIGALVGLMAIAVAWDSSGVAYSLGEDHVKTATIGTNLAMDTLLLRLQVRELAKRLAESPALREGLYKSALTKLSTSAALDLVEKVLGKVPVIGSNPIGWLVNIAYLTTTVVNWAVDQNRSIDKLQGMQKTFLMGAGIPEPQADVLKRHGWWTGEPTAAGFAGAYHAAGGDPNQFIDYIKGLDPHALDAALRAMEDLPGQLKPDQEGKEYLRLPEDPTKAKPSPSLTIRYNGTAKRWEDPATRMYWSPVNRLWMYDVKIDTGSTPPALKMDDPVSYDPATGTLSLGTFATRTIRPESVSGLQSWMSAWGMTPPQADPNAPAPKAPEPQVTPKPPSPAPQNLYPVRKGDSLHTIAGDDSWILDEIYRINPWLNEHLAGSGRATPADGRQGRNPDELELPDEAGKGGDVLILPDGYAPPP